MKRYAYRYRKGLPNRQEMALVVGKEGSYFVAASCIQHNSGNWVFCWDEKGLRQFVSDRDDFESVEDFLEGFGVTKQEVLRKWFSIEEAYGILDLVFLSKSPDNEFYSAEVAKEKAVTSGKVFIL